MFVRNARDVGASVRALRKQAGLSQAELAVRAGVGRQWLVDLEHGKRTVELELVLVTLRELGAELRIDSTVPGPTERSHSSPTYDGLAIGDPETVLARTTRKSGKDR